MDRLAHGEHSHATRDYRRVRGCFLCAHRRISEFLPRLLHGSTWISLRALGHSHLRVLLGNAKP